jgi:pre-mRNA-splicing factor ATP-dependent RNA helicase DHX38/PRP16
VPGMTVIDSEVLEPEPVRQGGLVRMDAVSYSEISVSCLVRPNAGHLGQSHTFRAPARPLEPPTPRTSVLGLDRLASEKRTAAALLAGESSRKRARLDEDDGSLFKGGTCHRTKADISN